MNQWGLTLELVGESIRGGSGLSYKEAVSYSLPFDALLGMIVPQAIPNHSDQFTGEKYFWIWSAWWGIVATVVMVFSYKLKSKKLILFSLLLGSVGCLWSLGEYLDSFEMMHKYFFLLRLFRYPPVALFWTITAAALLVTCGFEGLHKWRPQIAPNKFLTIIGLLLVFELWNYGQNISPTVGSDYYRFIHPAIHAVMEDRPGTVLLSPKANRSRRLSGNTLLQAKIRFRGFLFDLTNLPYRIKTLIPSGEPLALKSYHGKRQILFKTKSFDALRPLFNFWNLTHFLTKDELDSSWVKIAQDHQLNAYRNPQAMGPILGLKQQDSPTPTHRDVIQPLNTRLGNHKMSAKFETDQPITAFFNVPFYPGWKIYCAKCKIHGSDSLPISKVRDFFSGTSLPAGLHHLTMIYYPTLWQLVLGLSVITLCALAGWGILNIKRKT